ncbi:hypothetical protein FRB90_007008 [Tulasnella sp. 427]|nr:hypothetical protein FRB90_007008 [Tulasnella sp. 427]
MHSRPNIRAISIRGVERGQFSNPRASPRRTPYDRRVDPSLKILAMAPLLPPANLYLTANAVQHHVQPAQLLEDASNSGDGPEHQELEETRHNEQQNSDEEKQQDPAADHQLEDMN